MMQNIETAHRGALNVFLCIAECHCSPFSIGMNQFNHMALPNAQMSQAPMGARAASPMNHPQQMNLSSVPAVRRGKIRLKNKSKRVPRLCQAEHYEAGVWAFGMYNLVLNIAQCLYIKNNEWLKKKMHF